VTDTVIAALVGVGGAVIVALASAVTQVFITRTVIRAEREKVIKNSLVRFVPVDRRGDMIGC